MRPFRSLQFKISATLFLVGTLLIVISAIRLYSRSAEVRKESVRSQAFAKGSRLSGMAQHLLRRRSSRAADLEMSYASMDTAMLMGMIISPSL